MNKTSFWTRIVLVLFILALTFVGVTLNRYKLIYANANGFMGAYKMDRLTGELWSVIGDEQVSVKLVRGFSN